MQLKLSYVFADKHPVIGDVFYSKRDILGEDSEKKRYQKFLADILPFLARTSNDCNSILNKVEHIKADDSLDFEIEGEDVDAHITFHGVQIDILLDDSLIENPDGYFSLEVFERAITAWRDFLELPQSPRSSVITELPEFK